VVFCQPGARYVERRSRRSETKETSFETGLAVGLLNGEGSRFTVGLPLAKAVYFGPSPCPAAATAGRGAGPFYAAAMLGISDCQNSSIRY